MQNRRDFLKISALASGAVLMPNFIQCLGSSGIKNQGKKLVIIQQSGGNDGLNTFIPYRNDLYFKARPQLAVPNNEVIRITDEIGFHPSLNPLRELYDQGMMSIINSVGYPNPNRSHFRSMDIWHSGSNADEYWDTGWLGRYLDATCKGCAQPHEVLEWDDTLSLAVKGSDVKGLATRDPRQLHKATEDRYLKALMKQFDERKNGISDLDYMYKTLTETMQSTEYIYEFAQKHKSRTPYPQNPFSKGLKHIAELINSGVETTVFYVSLTGFDTHANQRNAQDRLLKVYAESVSAFVKDLQSEGNLDNTLILTFSEFGRRVAQNASGGTDHGKANSLTLIGGNLKQPGVFNQQPDLQNLDDGDLAFQVDFRRIYADILDHWLETDSKEILGRRFAPLQLC